MEASSASSSDEECLKPAFWNNWSPDEALENKCFSDENQTKRFSRRIVFNSSRETSISSFENKCKFGNWIPPLIFLNDDSEAKLNLKTKQRHIWKGKETSSLTERQQVSKKRQEVSKKTESLSQSVVMKKEINGDWGERVQLHDVTKFSDGDTIWGLVNLGLFAKMKLWVNQYGNICGSADGKISKISSTEMSYIFITNTHLLRKMLGLSSAQWSLLCETVQETKTALKFDAFENFEVTGKTRLEKLWFFICKRRHFLSPQCMLVQLSGAIKCMKQFQIIPKLVVVDIRNFLGEPTL